MPQPYKTESKLSLSLKQRCICHGTISIIWRMPWETTINHDPNADYYQFTTFLRSDMMIKIQKTVLRRRFTSYSELLSVCLPFRPKRVFEIYEHILPRRTWIIRLAPDQKKLSEKNRSGYDRRFQTTWNNCFKYRKTVQSRFCSAWYLAIARIVLQTQAWYSIAMLIVRGNRHPAFPPYFHRRLMPAMSACQKSACHSEGAKRPWESVPQESADCSQNSIKNRIFWRTDCHTSLRTGSQWQVFRQSLIAGLCRRCQTVEKPQFCVRQNWGFEHIVAKIWGFAKGSGYPPTSEWRTFSSSWQQI